MRRDQALALLPQIAAKIRHYEIKAKEAEQAGDMTARDDARRNIKKLTAERTRIIQEHH